MNNFFTASAIVILSKASSACSTQTSKSSSSTITCSIASFKNFSTLLIDIPSPLTIANLWAVGIKIYCDLLSLGIHFWGDQYSLPPYYLN